jgi:Aspartyl protease
MAGGCYRAALHGAIFGIGIAFLAGPASAPVCGQQAPKPEPNPPANAQPAQDQQAKPAPTEPQLPGAGAQVRTGSQFGEQSFVSRLARLLGDHQFSEIQSLIDAPEDSASSGPAKLTLEQKQLYRGVLANRENKPQESIRLLEPLVAKLKSGTSDPDEKLLRKTLAEDYLRAGDLAKANQAYLEFEYRFGGSLSADERAEIELPVRLLPLAFQFPPMSVEPGEPFSLPYDRDALGLTDVPVFVDGQSHDWMLDPTAPFNLICRTTAKEIGLKISDESATVTVLTGRPMRVQAAVIPRFTIGTVTYRDMTVFVFDDKDYFFPKSNYQVRGVLGYPAVSALGSLTVTAESNIEVQPGEKGEHLTGGAPFYLDGDRIIAALGKPGDERMFAVDASGQQTYLTSRYFSEHSEEFANKKMQLLKVPGTQKLPPAPAYDAESVTLEVGATPVTLHYVQVLTEPLGNAALDDVYGTLGMDALDELKSYTFDYRTMRFAVKSE